MQKFLSKDAAAHLWVYGSNNVLDEFLEDQFREESRDGLVDNPKKVVTYNVLKNNWLIVSEFITGRFFLSKKGVEFWDIQKFLF